MADNIIREGWKERLRKIRLHQDLNPGPQISEPSAPPPCAIHYGTFNSYPKVIYVRGFFFFFLVRVLKKFIQDFLSKILSFPFWRFGSIIKALMRKALTIIIIHFNWSWNWNWKLAREEKLCQGRLSKSLLWLSWQSWLFDLVIRHPTEMKWRLNRPHMQLLNLHGGVPGKTGIHKQDIFCIRTSVQTCRLFNHILGTHIVWW